MPKPLRDRMGRLNPNDPHPFAPQMNAVEDVGGSSVPSRACAVCGGSRSNPVHIGNTNSQQSVRDRMGPWGQ